MRHYESCSDENRNEKKKEVFKYIMDIIIYVAVAVLTLVIGFAAGAIFQTNGTDPGGGRTNNLWIIWTVAFIGIIIVSVVLELILKKKR